MLTSLKKLTASNEEAYNSQLKGIRGGRHGCCYECDPHCGDKVGSMGAQYETLSNFWYPSV